MGVCKEHRTVIGQLQEKVSVPSNVSQISPDKAWPTTTSTMLTNTSSTTKYY